MKDIANKNVKRAAKELNVLLNSVSDEIRIAIKKHGIKYKTPFWKNNKALYNSVKKAIKNLNAGNLSIIESNIKSAWNLANTDVDKLVIDYIKKKDATALLESKLYSELTEKDILSKEIPVLNSWLTSTNTAPLNSFINRSVNGLRLSGRVWKISQKATKVIEETLKSGIIEGRSADQIAKILQQALKNPNNLARIVTDINTNALTTVRPADLLNLGRGVYKSAYKNAFRLARTEINMAYRNAESQRINQIPFIVGYDVHLSNSHPVTDICDFMTGSYPKNFVFIGWHPACICYTTTRMLNDKDFKSYLNTGKIKKEKYTQTMPKKATTYIFDNKKAIERLKNQPYWLSQNEAIVKRDAKI